MAFRFTFLLGPQASPRATRGLVTPVVTEQAGTPALAAFAVPFNSKNISSKFVFDSCFAELR
jgi:hypothetical protein